VKLYVTIAFALGYWLGGKHATYDAWNDVRR
jgi:hypothetical protein